MVSQRESHNISITSTPAGSGLLLLALKERGWFQPGLLYPVGQRVDSHVCVSFFSLIAFTLFCIYPHLLPRQEKKLSHNISVGIITTNQSLVLQRVSRHSAGRYRCSATNREGETESDVFHLNVKCKPL
jgi:hypothetical protein